MYICVKEPVMSENKNQVVESSTRKKKKFVYLDKYELHKDQIDERIRLIQVSVNIGYGILGVIITCLVVLALFK